MILGWPAEECSSESNRLTAGAQDLCTRVSYSTIFSMQMHARRRDVSAPGVTVCQGNILVKCSFNLWAVPTLERLLMDNFARALRGVLSSLDLHH